MKESWETAPLEEKWMEEARKTTELLEPPESLSPEAVVERLKQENRKPEKTIRSYRYLAQAAVLFLVLIIGGGSFWLFKQFGEDREESTQDSNLEAPARTARMEEPEEGQSIPGGYRAAASYEEICDYLKWQEKVYSSDNGGGEIWFEASPEAADMDGAADMAASQAEMEMAAEAPPMRLTDEEILGPEADVEYSETNVQVKGVDEADIVKTDGKFLYVVYSGRDPEARVHIIKVDGGNMREMSKTEPVTDGIYRDYDSVLEIYVDGDTMTVLMDCVDEDSAESYTAAAVYDITDRKKPELTGFLRQDGYYKSSRKNGSYVYIFTTECAEMDEDDVEGFAPRIEGRKLSYGDIYYSPEVDTDYMMIATALNTENPEEFTDQKAVFCSGQTIYVSENAIYAGESVTGRQKTMTEIFKLSYKDGKYRAEGSKRILGRLDDQFSMDEYKGYLRLVTTVYDSRKGRTTNSLYVLDENMEVAGYIHNLAPDEEIYSARFMGDTGYFVTFRNTDPLFSVDLSDPENPEIMGELKITGFSSYLHSYADGKLLGIGREVDPRTGAWEGLKLSMFDTSNPYDVTEEDKEVLDDYWDSEALYNHKAVLIDTEKNIFGFFAYRDEWRDEWMEDEKEYDDYVLYSYDEEWGFTKRLSIPIYWGEAADEIRGVYIGDTLYLIGFTDSVRAYSLRSGEEIGRLKFK